jgi:hypothetical protein
MFTVRRAPVVVRVVAVVAQLAGIDYAVTTFDRRLAGLTGGGTHAVGFDLTCAVAPIAGKGVAVVAFFVEVRVDHTVTTSGPCLAELTGARRLVVASGIFARLTRIDEVGVVRAYR